MKLTFTPGAVVAWLIVVLAVYRLTIFFVFDSLMGFNPTSGSRASDLLDKFAYNQDGSNRSFLRGKIGDLLTCPWCLGAHIAWVVVCLWLRVWPWALGVHGWIAVLAVAGASAFLVDHTDVGGHPGVMNVFTNPPTPPQE